MAPGFWDQGRNLARQCPESLPAKDLWMGNSGKFTRSKR